MRILREEFENPVWGSRVALSVFELPEGYLVSEERNGTTTVVATLGSFDAKDAALDRVRRRAEELERQRHRRLTSAA